MELNGTAAIVAGGASGLGEAVVRLLAEAKCKVAIFDQNVEQGVELARAVGASFWRADVTDETSVAEAIAAAEAEYGVARLLVNCAGIGPAAKTISKGGPHSLALFRKVIEVNLIGSFNLITKFAARLVTAEPLGEERGVIINTASVAAYDGQIGQAAYAASKGAVVSMTLPIARDLAEHAIRVVTIAPGIFMTPMLQTLPAPVLESLGRQAPFPNRAGKPAEFAQLVRSIVENPMLNGETIRLDAAIRMGPK